MDKIPTDISAGAALTSTKAPAETRTLRDVVYNSKRSGGNYGSLAKSQTQQTYYISHKIESDDTLQRLALKYSINVCIFFVFMFINYSILIFKIQEIKRVNKLWSDAELGLREVVYIPVTTVQLTTLRNLYPNLEIVQTLSNHQKASVTTTTDNESTSSIPSSDSSNSIQSTTATTNSSYHDYLSKIDQRIQSTKNSLQSLDIKETYAKYLQKILIN